MGKTTVKTQETASGPNAANDGLWSQFPGSKEKLAETQKSVTEATDAVNMMKWLAIIGVGLLVLMYCQNQDLKDKQKASDEKLQKMLDQQKQQVTPITYVADGATSSSSGTGNPTTSGKRCETNWDNSLRYTTGDCGQTCASLHFKECRDNEYCQNEQWARSVSTPLCCASECAERVQTSLIISGLAKPVIVERVGSDYIVWYGNSRKFDDFGYSNAVKAVPAGNSRYQFQMTDGATYTFQVVRSEGSTLEVKV